MMTFLVLAHLVTGLVAIANSTRLGRRALALAVVGPALTLVWLAVQAPDVVDGHVVTERVEWVPQLGLDFTLRLDAFALLMALLVSGIGVLVLVYSAHYFAPRGDGLGRLIGLLALFAGSMLGLVLADNLLALFVFWELTSITSYFLIGNDNTQARARAAALQALLVTGAGGLVMLAGFVLIGQAAGTYQLSAILADPPSGTAVTVGLVLVLVAAMTKSAQYPFHSWLPGAMVAPTPVSAYLHSATMVKAGVYLVARFAPAFATVGPWRAIVLVVGLVTMICGGLRAIRQYDLKLLLAFGTISQLGFLMVVFGTGTVDATLAGAVLILAHAMFKAALFLVVGIVDHETGTRDLRRLDGSAPSWRPVRIIAVVSAASMAGIPLTLGFVGKEAAFDAFAHGQIAYAGVVLVALVIGSALTFAYSARLVLGGFFWPARAAFASTAARATGRVAPAFWAAPAVLGGLGVVFGVAPFLVDPLVDASVRALVPGAQPHALELWHGITVALGASLAVFAIGGFLVWAREPVGLLLVRGARLPTAEAMYLRTLRGVNLVADRVTGVAQSGSLPVYAGVILLTAAVLPGVALVQADAWPATLDLAPSPVQLAIGALVVGAAAAAATVRRRFAAALCLGVAGYGMAGLFVIQGAPDLALTQVTVETLTVIVFVLVLRRLPDEFEQPQTPTRRGRRAAIALCVGAMVFMFAIVAGSLRTVAPVSVEMIERSLPDGHGRNVVNVILVDFRGFDTLGEITVLAVAAIGAVALARAGRRPARVESERAA